MFCLFFQRGRERTSSDGGRTTSESELDSDADVRIMNQETFFPDFLKI